MERAGVGGDERRDALATTLAAWTEAGDAIFAAVDEVLTRAWS